MNKKNNIETDDIICLSNLEEVVFYSPMPKYLSSETKSTLKAQQVDYDKYLEYFE